MEIEEGVAAGGSHLLDHKPSGDEGVARALREHYAKSEHRIPMRDGTRLFTSVYAPKNRSKTYPFLLFRTPFGIAPYGVDDYPTPENTWAPLAPLACYVQNGYIFVHQDVRGRMMSEGEFVDMRPYIPNKTGTEFDESSDAYDTIEWLLRSIPGHNGRVGIWGVSYSGFYAGQSAIDPHPALKAVSPQAPATEWFIGDDFHHHGAFYLADGFAFSASLARTGRHAREMNWGFDYGCEDLYDFFLRLGPLSNADGCYFNGKNPLWSDLMTHGTRDAFWRARDPRPHYRDPGPAVLIVGGWFDEANLFGTLETYRAMLSRPEPDDIYLAMGPWQHCSWLESDGDRLGNLEFGCETTRSYREGIEHPFFRYHLKGIGTPPPKVASFETGNNLWRTEEHWPPTDTQPLTLWFQAGQGLHDEPPADGAESSWDEYLSDPAAPVPCRARPVRDLDGAYMVEDQRFVAQRSDVLLYQSEALAHDLTLAGPLTANLWVSVTGTDADFIVKLIDVHPESHPDPEGMQESGYQQLLRAEVVRAKFRNSYERPEPMEPGKPTLIRFALLDVSHTFHAGHRLMVQVQSTWFPLVDRNPQTFVDIYSAGEDDFEVAIHRIHRSPEQPSGLTLTVRHGTWQENQR